MTLESFSFLIGSGASPLGPAFDAARDSGFSSVEIGAASGDDEPEFLDAGRLLRDAGERRRLLDAIGERSLAIAALVRRGNPLHPVPRSRRACRGALARTIRLASLLGVPVVATTSGRPGAHAGARHANWVTSTFPPDFEAVVRRQWDDVAIPYWRERARFALDHGVRIAIDLDPGSCVYDAEGLLRLRAEAGAAIGASLGPARLFRQGLDPAGVVRRLGAAAFRVACDGARERIGRHAGALADSLEAAGFRGPVSFELDGALVPLADGSVRGVGGISSLRAAGHPSASL